MPNTRRRKFSVQNNIIKGETNKIHNGIQCSQPDPELDMKVIANNLTTKSNISKFKACSNSSKNATSSEIVVTCKTDVPTMAVVKQSTKTFDKDVTASSSNIELSNIRLIDNVITSDDQSKESIITQIEVPVPTNNMVQPNRDKTRSRRDRHPREHRVKVRSPKRRGAIYINNNDDSNKQTTGTTAIDWNMEICNSIESHSIETLECTQDQDIPNDNSLDDMCRICHGGDGLSSELGLLISACSCRGTVGRVHVKCLERWLTESGKTRCELCGSRYSTKRVHRYGVARALVMWILSQNSKQLIVDSLGIMLMSPLAVLAAWLSGRTLAGLMTQDSHVTPWPLASTFVLACMTLVCYYCWIVSAATRHAIGWWIWYKSQYEVRLEFQEVEN